MPCTRAALVGARLGGLRGGLDRVLLGRAEAGRRRGAQPGSFGGGAVAFSWAALSVLLVFRKATPRAAFVLVRTSSQATNRLRQSANRQTTATISCIPSGPSRTRRT